MLLESVIFKLSGCNMQSLWDKYRRDASTHKKGVCLLFECKRNLWLRYNLWGNDWVEGAADGIRDINICIEGKEGKKIEISLKEDYCDSFVCYSLCF